MRECVPTSKYNIMMDSIRLFSYVHVGLHPVDITFESSRMGTCKYKLECSGHILLLKRKDAVVDKMHFAANEMDATLVLGDDCSISFARNQLSNDVATS
jgi:hypothetical protein